MNTYHDRRNKNRTYHPHQAAPAGYGKSTLTCCWLEMCDAPGAWVSLDENDNDLRLFLSYLIAAVQNIFPTACSETISMLRVEQLPPVSRLAGSLINELDLIEKGFILVLDDYHLIQDKNIHKIIAKLLEHPAACMHLVLIARRDPPLPLTALRASGEMTEMRTRNLRFSLDETRVFLQQMTGMSVDRSVAAILEEKTEGWVTGLVIVGESTLDELVGKALKKDRKRVRKELKATEKDLEKEME